MATTLTPAQQTNLDLLVKAIRELDGCGIIVNGSPCADDRNHNGDHITGADLGVTDRYQK